MSDTGRVRYNPDNPWATFVATQMNNTPGRVFITEWAERFGIGRDTIYRWLNGKVTNISDDTAARVADVFGVDISEGIEAARRTRGSILADTPEVSHGAARGGQVPRGFGKWLTETRQRTGFATSEALAAAANLHPDIKKATDLIHTWEQGRGRRPEVWEALGLAHAMRVPEIDVMAESGVANLSELARSVERLVESRGLRDPDVEALRRFVQNMPDIGPES